MPFSNLDALPPVLLFHGPSPSKTSAAEKLAYRLLQSEKSPDFHPIFPDKNGLHSIQSIRELIRETALPPFEAKGKVFLIHEADKMLPTSSNALLKTLEEPPPATWFILLSGDKSALLPTILSRCRMFYFADATLDKEETPETALFLETLKSGLEKISLQRLEEKLKESDKEDRIPPLLTVLLYWMRDIALLQAGGDSNFLYHKEHRETIEKQARSYRR